MFSDTGMVTGTVRRFNQAVVSSGTVVASGDALLRDVPVPIGTGGTYVFTGLPAGSVLLTATVPHPQGTPLIAATSTVVRVGEISPTEITIGPTGIVRGFVHRGSGEAVVFVRVELRGAGGLSRSTDTDTGGRFVFSDVPVGPVTLETFDPASNTAASLVATVIEDQTTDVDLILAVGGSAAGLVTLPSGQPVSGAQVTLVASNGTLTTTTGADGRYRVDHVNPGNVTVQVTDPASGLRGRAAGSLGLSGQTLTLNVTLFASGTVNGTVFRFGGAVPVPGAVVSIDRFLPGVPSSVTTDLQGRFSFDPVPVGAFNLDVTDLATGDRGRASNQVSVNGEVRTVNVTLNGQGRVVVTVRDASGNLITGASVTLFSSVFYDIQTGTTGADGTITFPRVLAGPFTVSATDPVTLLGGSASGSVAVGATSNVTVNLQPAGTVLGRVFAPSGSPVVGVPIRLSNYALFREVTSGADGSFRFNAVPLGTYTLEAVPNGRLRARETGIGVAQNGDVVVRNLKLVGLGSVIGHVLNPDGTAAPGVGVTVQSTNALGGFFTATTDGEGSFEIDGVLVGGFVATAASAQTRGETSGRIDSDGQQVTANIQLLDNAINLPVNFYDANNSFFNLQGDGSIPDGTNSLFEGDFASNRGGLLLDVVSGGSPSRFTGGTIGTTEESGREVALRQTGLAGLDVTRKVFVPRTGYFARYLEILSNPTADPVTVDVHLLSNLRQFNGPPRVVATSSGDTTLDVSDPLNPDRWVAVDDGNDGDPFLVSTLPASAFAFDGPGAPLRAGEASFATPGNYGQLHYGWNGVTIPAGGTVAFLHFALQQTSRVAARASAERLVQLPPEALTGLSPQEIGWIRNFAVPSDGTSALTPLPALNGAVSGRALAGDGTTPVAGALVRFRSRNIFYGRTQSLNAGADGSFSFTSTFNDFGSSRPIPVDGFVLQAFHPQTFFQAPDALGSFPEGQTSAAQDAVFSNTGVLRGTVRRHTGAAVTSGAVQASGPVFQSANLATDGSYVLTVVPPGSYTVTGIAFVPQGSSLTGTTSASVTAGQVTVANVTIQPTGAVSGTVRNGSGTPAANVFMSLNGSGASRSTQTDGTGRYTFSDVPVGSFTVTAYEPNTNVPSSAVVTVSQDQTTTQDLTLVALGTVRLQVSFAAGGPAAGVQVNILEAARGFFRFAGTTDASGRLDIVNVPTGAFTVRAFHPVNFAVFRDASGSMPAVGGIVPVALTLPAMASVQVTVHNATGDPVAGATVNLRDAFSSFFRFVGTTDSAGQLVIASVPEGAFTVQAIDPVTSLLGEVSGTITAAQDGQTVSLTVNLVEAGLGVLRFRGERDLWVFTANAGDSVRVAEDKLANGGYPALPDPFVEVYNPDGSFLGANDDSGGNFNSLFQGTLTQSGRHVVVATAYAEAYTGGYRITVTVNGTTVVPQPFPGGTVTGHVYQGDGVTPLPNTRVRLSTGNGPRLVANVSTDTDGLYTVTGVPFGALGGFTASALDANAQVLGSATGNVPNRDDTVVADIRLPQVGTITGQVAFARGTPAPFTSVQVFGPGINRFAQTDAAGTYTFSQVPVGPSLTVRAYHPSDGALFRDVTGVVLTSHGETRTVDVTLPATATVQVTVLRGDGSRYSGAYVYIQDSARSFFAGTADVDGMLFISNVPEGAFSLQAYDPGNGAFAGSTSGVVTAADDAGTILATITAPFSGDVQGTVFAADGQTGVSNAYLQAYDVATGASLAALYADGNGSYRFAGLNPGDQGFRIVAYSPDFETTVQGTGAFTAQGQLITLDLTLPVSVVRGTVFFSDGTTTVPFPNVFVTQGSGEGSRTFYASFTDAGGHYRVFGAGVGSFTVTAQDGNSGLRGTATGTIADVAVPVDLDVLLQASGTVTGTVRDAAGVAVPFADVALTSSGLPFDRFGQADDQGGYRFERVALGDFTVQARDSATALTAAAGGTLAADGDTATIDLSFPATGTVMGTIFAADGVTPVASAPVTLQNMGGSGPLGFFSHSTTADATGHYEATGIPVGTVRVSAHDPSDSRRAGSAEGTLTEGTPATIDVTLEPIAFFRFNLDGADGFRYDVDCTGQLNDGGTVSRSLNDAYDGAYFLKINGQFFPCFSFGRLEDGGREISIGSASMSGLSVTRKVFVPAGGGFARYLEILSNPTAASQTVTVQVESNLGSDSSTRVVVPPSLTANSFAVTDQQGFCCDPALAHVFEGPGAPTGLSAVQFTNGNDDIFYRWSVTVPAGGTAIVMHFAVQRGLTDTAGAQSQAEALVNLTDANALAGMSAAERAQVTNFVVP